VGGTHDGNINIGCWVLAGLLVFMIIEKLFPESNDDEVEVSILQMCVVDLLFCSLVLVATRDVRNHWLVATCEGRNLLYLQNTDHTQYLLNRHNLTKVH